MAEVFGDSLTDARVKVKEADVGRVIRAGRGVYDAILLDVDNGPDGLTCAANDGLYDMQGLRAAFIALRPGGVLSVWSSGPDRAFAGRLGKAGFTVEEVKARAKGAGGARHIIWIATRGE
jgi:spermidine synthase